MNILFLSLAEISDLQQRGIYTDLLREFAKNGHYVRVVSPCSSQATENFVEEEYSILHVQTMPIQKTSLIRKGIATLTVGQKIKRALVKYCTDEHYDLILMATPPVTLAGVVKFIKNRDHAKVYLMLKDIWPQGIADLGAIRPNGPIFRYFRIKEKALYRTSNFIGCMSPANVEFVLKHNPEIPAEKVEVCPNCIEPIDMSVTPGERRSMRQKYGIPQDKIVFVYGGNLGRPQGIPFLMDCIRSQKGNPDAFFLVVGSGTEYGKLEAFAMNEPQENFKLMASLPKEDYDRLAASCDIGMIFLDHRFTIPNFPSRLLAYMQARMPVLSVTDVSTDVGRTVVEGDFGWSCESNDVNGFSKLVTAICGQRTFDQYGDRAWNYLQTHYTVAEQYQTIMKEIGDIR